MSTRMEQLLTTLFFFFNDTATTEIYTLSLPDALPISSCRSALTCWCNRGTAPSKAKARRAARSEEHTSELQSQSNLVCRLLLEKKKKRGTHLHSHTTTTFSPSTGRSSRLSSHMHHSSS